MKILPARIYCWMNPIPIPSNPRSETITETLKRHELPPPSVPRNLFKKGTTWVSSTTPKLHPCCHPTFRFLEEFPETAKTWCDGSGWDGFGPLLLSELLLRVTKGPGCCWLSTGMKKRLLPCVFVGIVRHGGEVDQIDSSQSNKSKFCQSKAIKDAGLQDLRVTIRLATELPLKQSTVACLAGPTRHTYI